MWSVLIRAKDLLGYAARRSSRSPGYEAAAAADKAMQGLPVAHGECGWGADQPSTLKC